jgi:N-acetylmuramoyl-L-alanine amidase
MSTIDQVIIGLDRKKTIVLHHSLTKDSGTVSWSAIRKYHTETNGWLDIGYHYGIERIDGHVEILQGRLPWRDAAAVKEGGLNRTGIHICLVGNFDVAPPDGKMWEAALHLVRTLCVAHDISVVNVKGHRDYASYKSRERSLIYRSSVKS